MYPIIDCHCHIYPDKIAQKASEATGKFYDIKMHYNGTAKELGSIGAAAQISHYIVFSVATTPKQVASINSFIADLVSKNTNMTGLGTLHPDSADLEGDIENIISLGLRGVKLHPEIQGFKIDDYRCLKIYEKCEGKLPVLIHTGDSRYDMSNPNRLKPILETYTDLTVIGAHFGGYSVWENAVEELKSYKNFFVDTSSTFPFISKEQARRYIKTYGAEKIMFGTDYPMWNPKDEVEYLLNLGLDEDEYKKIFYENAQKLFKIQL